MFNTRSKIRKIIKSFFFVIYSKTPNQNGTEHYAVSSINQTNDSQNSHNTPSIVYSANAESFDEDDDLDNYDSFENPSTTALKAQVLKNQQQYHQQHQQNNLQNHSGLVSKASIESDCSSYTKQKDIIYADSQYDQVDAVQYQICETQEDVADLEPIGTALVIYDYKKGMFFNYYFNGCMDHQYLIAGCNI